MTLHELTSNEKHLIDIASVATVVGTVTQHLPTIAALFTIVWTCIRIWETETVRSLFGRNKKE